MRLLRQLQEELEEINKKYTSWLQRAEAGIATSKSFLEKLREESLNPFDTEHEEINFFKSLKPEFSAYVVYYVEVYNIELGRPMGTVKQQEAYLHDEYNRVSAYCQTYHEFYKYYKSGRSDMDEQYFLRERIRKSLVPVINTELDPVFSTGYDQLVARFRAIEMIAEYISESISALHSQGSIMVPKHKWGDTATSYVELCLLLDTSGVCNNSPIGVAKMAQALSTVFEVKLGNIYKICEEIKYRKKSLTPFLDKLKSNFERKVNNED